ncbi:MAG: DMT family transporter [Desulfobacterales bacterium]
MDNSLNDNASLNPMNAAAVRKSKIKQLTLMSLTVGAVLISFSGVWVKVAHVMPNVSAFYRVLIGGVALLAAALYRRELRWPGIRHLLLSLLCGLLLALDLWLYHYSIQYIGPGLGTILPNFQVFILAAVGVLFLKEPVRLIFLISLPLAFIGLFMIVGIDWSQLEPTYRIGVIYGLAAAVCYAGFLLSLRQLQADQMGTSFFYVLMTVSLTTAAFLGADIIYRQGSFQIPDLQSVLALLALGLLSHTVGWLLITNALPKIRASFSGLILLLQPALAFVWDVFFFHRPTTMLNWLGVLIALAAIYMGMARQSAASH